MSKHTRRTLIVKVAAPMVSSLEILKKKKRKKEKKKKTLKSISFPWIKV